MQLTPKEESPARAAIIQTNGEPIRARTANESGLAVARVAGHYLALAARPYAAGEILDRFEGELSERPDQYSVQVGADRHLGVPDDVGLEEIIDRFPWRFLNHSCTPNVAIRERELVALRDIEAHEQVTFDYDTTEWEIAVPFACHCGAASCRGEIRGFCFLSREARERLRPQLGAHLLARLDEEPACSA